MTMIVEAVQSRKMKNKRIRSSSSGGNSHDTKTTPGTETL